MKFIFIIGNSSVGKMSVGQELMKITDFRLFHNHMMIEPVIEIFGYYDGSVVSKLRESIFKEYSKSNNKGMIFTYMWAFDQQSDWDYVEKVKTYFAVDTQFYYIELVCSQEERLNRNTTENRLENKPSKRDIEQSRARLLNDDLNYRCESYEGEITFDNYLKIDNTDLSPIECAQVIKEHFNL